MRAIDLQGRRTVIWGAGREGRAAAEFIRTYLPGYDLTIIDENPSTAGSLLPDDNVVTDSRTIGEILSSAEVVVKSPGVSLYHSLVKELSERGVLITSLLNLFFAESYPAKTICVTGTKGKSTTASLIQQMLVGLGKKAVLRGNIGTALDARSGSENEFIVIEVSSYQAADFVGKCSIGVLTSIFPEHLDWHRSVENYYRDKLNLLRNSEVRIISEQAAKSDRLIANNEGAFREVDPEIGRTLQKVDDLGNEYLLRPHNRENLKLALAVIQQLGLNLDEALQTLSKFDGLPHRQKILGEIEQVQFVDDSLSTTPESAIVALEVFKDRPVTLIAGGHDRGIDYEPLVHYLMAHPVCGVVCLGSSGQRIADALEGKGYTAVSRADSMGAAVQFAKDVTPKGGRVLLSPAAPSFGMFRDYIDRGLCFARAAGF